MPPRLNPILEQDIIATHRAYPSLTVAQLATLAGCSRNGVSCALLRNGFRRNKPKGLPKMGDFQKITTNIYKADYVMLIDLFGKGWQVQIRDWIHERLAVVRQRTGKVLEDTK